MSSENEIPLYEPDQHASYTLEMIAEISGVASQTILSYQEHGLIQSSNFDDETVHTLRRLDYLRSTCEANLSGLKLILDLLDQVERLQTRLRSRH